MGHLLRFLPDSYGMLDRMFNDSKQQPAAVLDVLA
jgi:hypothetical protein